MKPKQLIFLFIVVIILGLVLVVKKIPFQKKVQIQEYVPLNFLSSLEDISRLIVYKGKKEEAKPIILVKDNAGKWSAESFFNVRLKKETVETLLESLRSLKGELRCDSAGAFTDFSIEDDSGLHIEIQDTGNKKNHIIAGLKEAGYSGGFIREEESTKTYFIDESILSKFGLGTNTEKAELKPDFFFDRSLLEFDENKVQSVSIKRIREEEVLVCKVFSGAEENGAKKWSFERKDLPFDLDASKVKKFLKEIQNKSAVEIFAVEEGVDYGFSNPVWEIVIEREEAEPLRLIAGKMKDDRSKNIYMQTKGASTGFIVAEYVYKAINKDDSYFFIDNPLRAGDTADQIITHSGKEERRYLCKVEAEGENKKWFLKGKKEPLPDEEAKEILDRLKKFSIQELLFDDEKINKKSREWFSIKDKDKEVFIDLYAPIEENKNKVYPAKKRGSTIYFIISEKTHQDIFK